MTNNVTETISALPARREDSLGCKSSQLRKDLELQAGDFTFYRKCRDEAKTSEVVTPASDRGFLVGVSLTTGHHRKIISGARSSSHAFERNSIYLRNFEDDYRADLHGVFDFVLIELSRSFVTDAYHERNGSTFSGFASLRGQQDPIFGHFAGILAVLLDDTTQASPLFVEQLGTTIGMHLINRYGNLSARSTKERRRLSTLHESRAKEMLLAQAEGNASLDEIARACNLSRSYFIQAFRDTTNRTPHQWLVERRVERARNLLTHSDASLSEVAVACGFSDQSHFTKIFSRSTGVPPGTWRRRIRR